MRPTPARLLVALVLAASVAGGAGAQTTTTAVAPPSPPVEEGRPKVEPGPDTPRGAMTRFLAACRAGQYARAGEYLNLRLISRARRPQAGPDLARKLEAVLDRVLWVDLERLSDQPDGDPNDGLPSGKDSLGTIETATGPVEVLLERMPQPSGPPVWKIASSTVSAIPALYEEFGWGPLARILPAPFFEVRLLQIRLWQWIGLGLVLVVAWLVSWLVRHLLVRVIRLLLSGRAQLDGGLAEHVAEPLRLAFGLAVFAAGLPLLGLAMPVHRFFVGLQSAGAIVAFTWLVLRVLDVLTARVERRLASRSARAVSTVPLFRRSIKVFVAVIAAVAALQNFGFNVTGILAGFGVAGLAVALAAQKTVENLIGSISLVADQPVRIGDLCRFGATLGTVEDIGLRSTRIRTLERTVVTIPNAQFSTLPLENLSRRDRMVVRTILALAPETPAERVRVVLGELKATLLAHPKVDQQAARARFVAVHGDRIEVELYATLGTHRWEEYVEIREQLLLGALDVLDRAGVRVK
jgi:MscS family membrane protein